MLWKSKKTGEVIHTYKIIHIHPLCNFYLMCVCCNQKIEWRFIYNNKSLGSWLLKGKKEVRTVINEWKNFQETLGEEE